MSLGDATFATHMSCIHGSQYSDHDISDRVVAESNGYCEDDNFNSDDYDYFISDDAVLIIIIIDLVHSGLLHIEGEKTTYSLLSPLYSFLNPLFFLCFSCFHGSNNLPGLQPQLR